MAVWFNISLWVALGYMMIMFNKYIIYVWDFGYPFFLTCWHCLFASIVTQILARKTNMLPGVNEGKITRDIYIKKIIPMGSCFAAGLVLGNYAYKYLSLAFIQMIKSSTPVFMLMVAFTLGREKPSLLQVAIVLLICAGVAASAFGELNFNLLGFVFQITALLFDVLRMTVMDTLLLDVKLDSLSTLYYVAPISTLLLLPGFFIFESSNFDVGRLDPSFCFILFLNALLAFSLNLSVYLLVSSTSSLVMSLCGLIKDFLVVLSSVCILGSPTSVQQITGYIVSLIGLNMYREFKKDPTAMQKRFIETFKYCPVKIGENRSADVDMEENVELLLKSKHMQSVDSESKEEQI